MLNGFHRLVAWLMRPETEFARSASASNAPPFDLGSHGDHWQNLLSSPMDARHYVMEDWSLSSALEPFAFAGSQGS